MKFYLPLKAYSINKLNRKETKNINTKRAKKTEPCCWFASVCVCFFLYCLSVWSIVCGASVLMLNWWTGFYSSVSMNTDELLVQLDFDETNVNHHHSQPSQKQQRQYNHHHSPLNSIDITLSANRIHLQQPVSPSRDTSEPILSTTPSSTTRNDAFSTLLTSNTVPLPQILDQITAAHHLHHRRAFSDDNSLTQTIQLQQHSNQTHSPVHSQSKPTENNHSLINLSHSPLLIGGGGGGAAGNCDNSQVNGVDNDDDEFTQPHLEPTAEIITSIAANGDCTQQLQHQISASHSLADDTVEVSLLADLSMDSRESQPLLGIGRDTHDFVYNNFPGKIVGVEKSLII